MLPSILFANDVKHDSNNGSKMVMPPDRYKTKPPPMKDLNSLRITFNTAYIKPFEHTSVLSKPCPYSRVVANTQAKVWQLR